MNTHEFYVSLETAKLLKEAGFDWDYTKAYFTGWGDNFEYGTLITTEGERGSIIPEDALTPSPTLAVAQRWLREVKGYYVAWEFNMNISSWGSELYDFANISVYIFVDSKQGNICKCRLKENYKMVEEAQEAGVKKALEMILEKGK